VGHPSCCGTAVSSVCFVVTDYIYIYPGVFHATEKYDTVAWVYDNVLYFSFRCGI
jgi:hypothetical protein